MRTTTSALAIQRSDLHHWQRPLESPPHRGITGSARETGRACRTTSRHLCALSVQFSEEPT
jgi:hypothetical protein